MNVNLRDHKGEHDLTDSQRMFCRAFAGGDTVLQAMTIAYPTMKYKLNYYDSVLKNHPKIIREISRLRENMQDNVKYTAPERLRVATELLDDMIEYNKTAKTKKVRDVVELLKYIGSIVRDKREVNIGSMVKEDGEPMSVKEKVEYFQSLYTSGKINEEDFEILRKSVFTAEENEFLDRINKALEKEGIKK
jgi:hypothetical protein